ncbi:MAG TPA: phosphatase domain-containing protein [Nocardioidaceae bacterium]|nr:phosphatase domain-containing protein [Nocardioidaceae bacterium]
MARMRLAAARWIIRAEQVIDARLEATLRSRSGWRLSVLPYVGHGTATRAHVRARVVLRRVKPAVRHGRAGAVLSALARYLSVDVPGHEVLVEVGGTSARAVSGREGYVDAALRMPGLAPGWHPLLLRLTDVSAPPAPGRLLVVDPSARLGVVSDLDDTVIHTGLTRAFEALRTTLLLSATERVPIPGVAQLYRALVAGDAGRAPVFYVSTGAWNLHAMLDSFLARHGFPAGPLILTDWGPGGTWLFRERSEAVKVRILTGLLSEHPQLRWVLVGDSGQHDPQAYAAVARTHPGRIHAVYIRDVPPHSPRRTARVRELASELHHLGVPMLLVSDAMAAAVHARGLGLIDERHLELVRAASSA